MMLKENRWAVDLCCGKGGWTRALMARGYRVVGFDTVRFPEYPGELVLQDVRTIDGAERA
jgi:23S rRNA C2498 (ribose-2'-O)-methylase RlmM